MLLTYIIFFHIEGLKPVVSKSVEQLLKIWTNTCKIMNKHIYMTNYFSWKLVYSDLVQWEHTNSSEQLKSVKHFKCWSSCKNRVILLRMMRWMIVYPQYYLKKHTSHTSVLSLKFPKKAHTGWVEEGREKRGIRKKNYTLLSRSCL